jgi:hypothetical protein
MITTLYHELFTSAGSAQTRENPAKDVKPRLGDQLDEIAVFALVAVAVFYVAVAGCWFLL